MLELTIASVMAMVSAIAGGLAGMWRVGVSPEGIRFFNGFSGGLLISIALVHLLPESRLQLNYPFALMGFGVFYLIQGWFKTTVCTEQSCQREHPHGGMLAWAGLSFHAFVDGIAMGVGFSASEQLGILIAFAILMHKAPIGFTLTGILLSKGFNRQSVFKLLFVFSLLTPVGAIVSGYILHVQEDLLRAALAFSGGTFMHISVSELLPEVHNLRSRKVIIYVLLGVFVGVVPRFFGVD